MLDVIVPGLAHETDDVGFGCKKRGELFVVFGAPVGAAGRSERDQGRPLQVELGLGPTEELVVFGVGAGPSTFDVGDSEIVEQRCHLQLVAGGQRDALLLGAVAKRRVVDLDLCCVHGVSCN